MSLPRRPPLKKSFMLTYGSGQIIEIMMIGVVGTFLLFYLTAVCGLRPDVAGLVLFISLAVDAVIDPLIGASTDGWRSRWGRRHPFMLAGLFLLPLAILGVFALPTGLPASWVFGYVLALNILMRVSHSIFILPYAALLPEFSSRYTERARMMTYRLILSVLSWAAMLWFAFEFIFAEEDSLSQGSSYVWFALLTAGVVLASGLLSTFGTLSAAKALPRRNETHPPLSRFFHEVTQLFQNASFISIFFGALIFMTASGFLTSMNIHAFQYFWALTPEQMQLPTIAQPVGMLISVPLAIWMIKSFEKRTIILIAIFAFAATFSVLPLLKSLGGLTQDSLATLSLVIAGGVVFGAGSGLSFVATGSMVADATDEHDFLFRIRREGLFFAALIFGSKTALGLGGMLAGFGLQLIGFPNDPTGSPELSPQIIEKLGLLWGPGFALCVLMSAPFFFAYKLDRKSHAEIIRRIRGRIARSGEQRRDSPRIN